LIIGDGDMALISFIVSSSGTIHRSVLVHLVLIEHNTPSVPNFYPYTKLCKLYVASSLHIFTTEIRVSFAKQGMLWQ
jgi:hypothetical protein